MIGFLCSWTVPISQSGEWQSLQRGLQQRRCHFRLHPWVLWPLPRVRSSGERSDLFESPQRNHCQFRQGINTVMVLPGKLMWSATFLLQLLFEAQFARIEKIKVISSTYMAACGLQPGQKNSLESRSLPTIIPSAQGSSRSGLHPVHTHIVLICFLNKYRRDSRIGLPTLLPIFIRLDPQNREIKRELLKRYLLYPISLVTCPQ